MMHNCRAYNFINIDLIIPLNIILQSLYLYSIIFVYICSAFELQRVFEVVSSACCLLQKQIEYRISVSDDSLRNICRTIRLYAWYNNMVELCVSVVKFLYKSITTIPNNRKQIWFICQVSSDRGSIVCGLLLLKYRLILIYLYITCILLS